MNQYKVFIFAIQVILGVQTVLCGFERTSQPTQAFSRAFSGAAMYTPDNLLMNPASLSTASSFRSSVFYSPSPFQLEQLSNYGIVSARDCGEVNIAFGLQSAGFSLYRESTVSLGAAAMITEGFSSGVNAHLCHLAIEHYGTALTAVVDAGAIFSVSEGLNIGVALLNMTGSSFGGEDDIPQTLITGLSYSIMQHSVVNIDLVKDVRYELSYRAGVELSPHERVALRAGTDGSSSRIFVGIGILLNPVQIDYGVAAHSELGLTHSLGITFQQ